MVYYPNCLLSMLLFVTSLTHVNGLTVGGSHVNFHGAMSRFVFTEERILRYKNNYLVALRRRWL